MGGQPIAWAELAGLEIGGNRIGQGLITRPIAGQLRDPDCHGDNLAIDAHNRKKYNANIATNLSKNCN